MSTATWAETSDASYLYVTFESPKWVTGKIPTEGTALEPVQGLAEIAKESLPAPNQFLQLGPSVPFAAVLIDSSRIKTSPKVKCQIQARLQAVEQTNDAEFLDFGGAVLGFFKIDEHHGEIWALTSRDDKESLWLSTGMSLELNSQGAAKEWLLLNLDLDRKTGRWLLALNGKIVLQGLRLVETAQDVPLALWLYGQEAQTNQFDNLVVTDIPLEELGNLVNDKDGSPLFLRMENSPDPLSQSVTQQKNNSALRQAFLSHTSPARPAKPRTKGWDIKINTGQLEKSMHVNEETDTDDPSVISYHAELDDQGRPKPVAITITADAFLAPGIDLRRMRWRVVEVIGYPDKYGQEIASGDFHSGLVQHYTLAPEWTKKVIAIPLSQIVSSNPNSSPDIKPKN